METIKKIPENVAKILREPLDSKAVTAHPTKSYLSTIKAIYVTERFNKAFGIGGWHFKSKVIEKADNGMIVVKVKFYVPDYNLYLESFGGNDNGGEGSKNFDLGDAYKGATTDALTKIGSYLEVGIDVFKGLNAPTKSNGGASNKETAPASGSTPAEETETKEEDNKPWLNRTYKNSPVFTKEWENVLSGIDSGKITDVAKVREVYKVNRALQAELEKEIAIRVPA
jgi:hypothetical protein